MAAAKKDGSECPVEPSAATWKSSVTDSLTGLYNYSEFHRLLEEEIERSRRYGPPVSLLMLDIDHFKQVSDAFGHQAGDSVLIELTETIVNAIRPVDKPARYGGEEFIIILPETDAAGVSVTAERVRERVEAMRVPVGHERTVGITISVGTAVFPADADSEQELVGQADRAMYAAKAAGRNRVSAAA